jgi:transposase-like protein
MWREFVQLVKASDADAIETVLREIGSEDLRRMVELVVAGDSTISSIAKKLGKSMSTVNKLAGRFVEVYRKIFGESEVKTEAVEKKPRETKETREPRVRGSGINEVLRVLGQEYAEVIKHVTEKVDWFTDVVVDIGFYSVIAAFQFARVDPKTVLEKIEGFKDPEEFKKEVLKYLEAMIRAGTEGAETIKRLQDEVNRLNALLILYKKTLAYVAEQRDQLISTLNKVIGYLRTALSIMNQQQIRRFYESTMLTEIIMSLPQMQQTQERKEVIAQ